MMFRAMAVWSVSFRMLPAIQQSVKDNHLFMKTIITVPGPIFTKTGQSAEIIPGMTVVVDIIGGKRSVLDYILTPINRATSVAFREN